MMKSVKKLAIVCFAVLLVLSLGIVAACKSDSTIEVTFSGGSAQTLSKSQQNIAEAPSSDSFGDGVELLGWSTIENAATADIAVGEDITYDVVLPLDDDGDGKVTLYPVTRVDNKIEITFDGSTQTYTVSSYTQNKVLAPEIQLEAKEVLLGWAISKNATEAAFATDKQFSYTDLVNYATDGKVTLYPVTHKYDMIVGCFTYWMEKSDGETGEVVTAQEYIESMQADFAALYPETDVLFREYSSSNAESCAQQVEADGDVDALIAGATAHNYLDVAGYAKILDKYSSDGKRYAVALEANDNVAAFMAMVLGVENTSATVLVKASLTSDAITTKVYGAIGNGAATPELSIADGKVLYGWATDADATKAQIEGELTYAAVIELCVEGSVTFYPVIGNTPDLVVELVLGTSSDKKVTDENYDAMKSGFENYLTAHSVDVTAINIVYRAFYGSQSNFVEQLGSDCDVIVAANNFTTQVEGYTDVWAENGTYAKSVRTGFSRSVGILSASTHTELAQKYYDFLTAVEVTLKASESDTGTVVTLKGEAALDTSSITIPENYRLEGWATTANADTAEITADEITVTVAGTVATDGMLTLYPVLVSEEVTYDLVVAIWAVNGSNTYATDEQIATLKTSFESYLSSQSLSYTIKYVSVSGKTADYPSSIPSDTMVILSGKNVESQCGSVGAYVVINVTFDSTRYASYVSAYQDNALAKMFVEYLCERKVTVTLKADESDTGTVTVLSELEGNTATVPTLTIPDGKQLAGWATTSTATEAQVTGSIDVDAVYELATDGAVTLYPVFEDIPTTTADVVIAVHVAASKTTYITDDQLATLKSGFEAYVLAQTGKTINIEWKTYSGVNNAAVITNIGSDSTLDAVVVGNLDDGTVTWATGYEKAKVTYLSFDTTRYVGVLDSSNQCHTAVYVFDSDGSGIT